MHDPNGVPQWAHDAMGPQVLAQALSRRYVGSLTQRVLMLHPPNPNAESEVPNQSHSAGSGDPREMWDRPLSEVAEGDSASWSSEAQPKSEPNERLEVPNSDSQDPKVDSSKPESQKVGASKISGRWRLQQNRGKRRPT